MNAIELESLTKFYGKSRGVEVLTLAVAEGDIFGFIGPNGAGKSTTIRTLLGLIGMSSGSAKIFGLDVEQNRHQILQKVGYMPSEASFYETLTVKQTIRLSAKLRGLDCADEAEQLCREFDLDQTKQIQDLSMGNRRKVSLVCALQHNPKLLILDEPTSSLDPLMQQKFWQFLDQKHQQGTTIFLSSHVLSEVQRHCKTAAIIRQGKLIITDKIENLAQTRTHKISIRGVTKSNQQKIHQEFELELRDFVVDGQLLTFLYSGDLQLLVAKLAEIEFADLSITEPDLEEVFLHYYQNEEAE